MSAVPCNGCRTCCRDQIVPVFEDDAPPPGGFITDPIPGLEGVSALRLLPSGECAHLGADGCTIYEHRPMVCREYDCRKQFLIMRRFERRQWKNSQIWKEARKRLGSLSAEDHADLADYRRRAAGVLR